MVLTLEEELHSVIPSAISANTNAYPPNRGVRAGLFENLNFGTHEAPLSITPETLSRSVAKPMMYLHQSMQWVAGEMILTLPSSIYPVLDQCRWPKLRNLERKVNVELEGMMGGFRVFIYADDMITSDAHEYAIAGRLLHEESTTLSPRQYAVMVWNTLNSQH